MDTTKHHKITGKVEAQANVPSSSSSPSHEFSFAISLHNNTNTAKFPLPPPPPPAAIDLSPADDIFFHGHLLPLHLLSHLPVSPRSSTNSIESSALPIRDLADDLMVQIPKTKPTSFDDSSSSNRFMMENQTKTTKTKPKSFSLFRWRRGNSNRDRDRDNKNTKKRRFEVSRVLKKYLSMIRPLLFFRERRENLQYHRQHPYNSFSGDLSFRKNVGLSGRREFSAPASMRVSPSNSGHLAAAAETKAFSGGDGTMEELQAAIQAAIAHCKNSIAAEEKC